MRAATQLTSGIFDNTPLDAEFKHEMEFMERGQKRLMRLAKDAVDHERGGKLRPAERIAGQWFGSVHAAILATAKGPTPQHGDFARVVEAVGSKRMAALGLMEIMSASMKFVAMAATTHVTSRLAQALQAEANHRTLAQVYRRQVKDIDDADVRRRVKRRMLNILTVRDRGTINKIARSHAAAHPEDQWFVIRKRLKAAARMLLEIIFKAAMLEVGGVVKPAFRHGLQHFKRGGGVRQVWYIYFDNDLIRKLSNDIHSRTALRPVCPPMLVPPLPWADDKAGGYALIRKPMVARSNKTVKNWHAKHDVSVPRARLNLLSQTAWCVNDRVLNVYEQMRVKHPDLFAGRWDEKEANRWTCSVPAVPPDDDPVRPEFPLRERFACDADAKKWYRTPEGKAWRTTDAGRAYRRAMRVWRNAGNVCGSMRYGFVGRLTDVRDCVKHERMWFPHHFDFRGRAQPMCTYVTHHGDDFMRGLLLFADSKPVVTERGRAELSRHCANMWGDGWDKATQTQQAGFVDQFRDFMLAIAADPVNNRGWFDADEPWQFLACCFAVADPSLAARLPRQRDATCNGLQHAAALVRDPTGAVASNLTYTGVRQSAYQRTADNLKAILDADVGNPAADRLLPACDDKLCKAPFMTDNYGVTMMGMAKQIYSNLLKRGWVEADAWKVRKYATGKMAEAIYNVCPAGRKARDWFTECCRIVAHGDKEHPGECFRWHIPGWLPAIQSYRTIRSERVDVIGHKFRAAGYSDNSPPDIGAQVRGAAPNIIHWIDGQHVLMVAERCAQENVTLATVFDSYWTHCETSDDLLWIILDTFVELHTQPILEQLHAFWTAEYPWATFPPPPDRGVFDIKHVYKAVDAFR